MRELVRLMGLAPERIVLPPTARIVHSKAGTADRKGQDIVILESHWQNLGQRALNALRAFHLQQPDEPGIDRGRLRRMAAPTVSDAVWRGLIGELVQARLLQQSEYWLHDPEHRSSLNDGERALAQKLQSALARRRLRSALGARFSAGGGGRRGRAQSGAAQVHGAARGLPGGARSFLPSRQHSRPGSGAARAV